MDNKKLFKFLYKDISEIEELFAEKGAEGFDDLEMEFIRTRFSGAKHIIQLLSERGIIAPELQNVKPSLADNNGLSSEKPETETVAPVAPRAELNEEEKEGLKALEEFEAEIADTKTDEREVKEETPEEVAKEPESVVPHVVEQASKDAVEIDEEPEVEDSYEETLEKEKMPEEVEEETPVAEKVSIKEEKDEINTRIGDRPITGKSVNDLLGGKEDGKLEYKISNSPVQSIQAAIGINDRYQYIRELFDGNAETFTKTVGDLDMLANIQEAVGYLQQNFKWKKNETSLKFVSLVKRRFPNG